MRSITSKFAKALLVALTAVLFAYSPGLVSAQTVAGEDTGPYRLRPGDVITVSVLEDAELDRQLLVLPDGRISLPIVGTVMAAGMTPQELEATVRSGLRRNFVKPPTVTVAVVTLGTAADDPSTREIYVVGEVARPGRFEYKAKAPMSVLKALSLAGGLGPFAARDRIQVRETVDGNEVVRVFDYGAIEDGDASAARDFTGLVNGAIIIVPERGLFD